MKLKNRIVSLSEADGLPVVLGSDHVSYQVGNLYVAYGPLAKGITTQFTYNAIVFLEKITAGSYLMIAEKALLDLNDPEKDGLSVKELGKDWLYWELTGTVDIEGETQGIKTKHRFAPGTVPATDASNSKPWTIGDITATKAKPINYHRIGGWDLAGAVEDLS